MKKLIRLFPAFKFLLFVLTAMILYGMVYGCRFVNECNCYQGIPAFEFMFNRYQVLLTGWFAVIVGFFSVMAIHQQINFEAKNRKCAEISNVTKKTKVYESALSDYLKRIRRTIRIVNLKNPRDTDGWTRTFIHLDPAEFSYLPKTIPELLMDWYYLSDLSSNDVNAIISIRQSLEFIQRFIDTLNPNEKVIPGTTTITHYEVLSAKWDKF